MKIRQDPTQHPLGSQVECVAMSAVVANEDGEISTGTVIYSPEDFLAELVKTWALGYELIQIVGYNIHAKLQALMLQTLERGKTYPFWLDRTDLRNPVRVYNVTPTLHTITAEQFFALLGIQGPPVHLSGKPTSDLAQVEHDFVRDLAKRMLF